ncbi:MAG: hypothetical protein H0W58_17800 [Acidobacteria bacterium]|jgi:hypothetical protein|nr:hypothetical protein [Acidobacteriota bacterium]
MNLETIIQEKVHALPPVKQAKVLAFVEVLTDEESNGYEMQSETKPKTDQKSKRYSFIGIGRSETGDVSARAEEILEKEIKRRSGWSLKDELVD